jgi:hypothetical protein
MSWTGKGTSGGELKRFGAHSEFVSTRARKGAADGVRELSGFLEPVALRDLIFKALMKRVLDRKRRARRQGEAIDLAIARRVVVLRVSHLKELQPSLIADGSCHVGHDRAFVLTLRVHWSHVAI